MADVVSEVQEDGSTEVKETARASNYEMELTRLDGALPEAPSTDALSKLFKPRFLLEITASDGTVIPFVYKRVDPMSLMLSQGSPMAVNPELIQTAQETQKRLQQLGVTSSTPPSSLSEDVQEDIARVLAEPKAQEFFEMRLRMRQTVIETGVISPQITPEIYEQLDDDIIEALYEAITGGVSTSNELVEHFREIAPQPAQS